MRIDDVLKSKIILMPDPVLSPGIGGRWDNKGAMTPSPWLESKDNWLMYYIGQSYRHDHWLIGLSASKDLLSWQKCSDEPLVDFRNKKMDHIFIDCPSLIKNKGKYFVFYEAKDIRLVQKNPVKAFIKKNFICRLPIGLRRRMIGFKRACADAKKISLAMEHAFGRAVYLTILDKFDDFTGMVSKKVFEHGGAGTWDCLGVFSPRIFNFKNKYYLLYGGSNGREVGSGLAVSDDLIHWQRVLNQPILKNGAKGSWDENHALLVDILELEDGYCGFYEGEDSNNRFRIGLATSKDLLHWQKAQGNPIVGLGAKGSFKERMVCGPRAILKDGEIFLFHAAHDKWMSGYCGLAILKNSI